MGKPDSHQRVLVSAKAILHRDGRVLFVKNSRSEWDLPGGKLQDGEDLEKCLEREIREELDISVSSSEILSAFKHHYYDDIIVIVYDCGSPVEPMYSLSEEHTEGEWFDSEQMRTMNIPENYKLLATEVCRRSDAHVDA